MARNERTHTSCKIGGNSRLWSQSLNQIHHRITIRPFFCLPLNTSAYLFIARVLCAHFHVWWRLELASSLNKIVDGDYTHQNNRTTHSIAMERVINIFLQFAEKKIRAKSTRRCVFKCEKWPHQLQQSRVFQTNSHTHTHTNGNKSTVSDKI